MLSTAPQHGPCLPSARTEARTAPVTMRYFRLVIPFALLAGLGVAFGPGITTGGASIACTQSQVAVDPCLGEETAVGGTRVDEDTSITAGLCRSAALESLETLRGHVFIARRAGFSTPRLIIRWRAQRLPDSCRLDGNHRSIAVSVRIKTSGSHGFIPIGLGKGRRQWLTFARGFSARPLTETFATGYPFNEALGCIRNVIGLARYRFRSARGVISQKVVPYHPLYKSCSDRSDK